MPGLEPRNTQSGRTYQWNDESFFSVTTILNALNKPALPKWAANSVAEYALRQWSLISTLLNEEREAEALDLLKGSPWREKEKAASTGTLVHEAVEAYVAGIDSMSPTTDKHVNQFELWLQNFKPTIIENEVTIFNRTYNYAGTLDLLVDMDTDIWLIDVKTGKGIYPEYAMQVAAYANGEFIGRHNGRETPLPKVTRGAILHLRPNGCKFIMVDISDRVFKSFLHCREVFRFVEEIAPTVIMGEVRR